MYGFLYFRLGSLQVIKSRAVSVTEGFQAYPTFVDGAHSVLRTVATVVTYILGSDPTVDALPGKRSCLLHGRNSLPLTLLIFKAFKDQLGSTVASDGDLIWTTTQESKDAKYKGAGAD